MRKYIITILTLLLPAAVFAAAPAINSAAFHESTNILEIFFDSPIYTDAAHFSIGGLTLDDDNGGDNPDVTLNGGDILNTSAQGNSISIKLVFTGNIGSYEIDPDEFFTWGKDYRRLQDIESFEDSVKLIVRENTYLGVNNGPNNAVNLADAVHVNIITDQNKTVLSSAEYNFATNKITLVFTGDVQWDSIDEDLMHIWFDAAGMEHRDPGNYILDAGEDRNDNGVLDFEPNIDLLSITLHDDSSSFTLSGGIIDNTADNDTIVISPLLDNYKIIETFDPNTLKITIPEYAVVDVNYNPVEGVSGFPMAIVPDNDPLTAVSAVYNMGTNELKVYFSGPMSTGYGILPKFSFVKDNSTVTLQGASSPPTISASGGNIKIKLLNQDQMYAEMLMQGEDSIKVTIDNYAVLDNLGNGNIDTEVMAALIPESGSNTPPEVDSVYYYARQNRLEVYFDVNLKKTAEYVNIQGFSLFNGVDTLTLTTDNFGGASSNKVLRINFNPTDELAVESSLNKESLYLLVEDFSVYQQTKLNGNWAVTLGDSVKVHYVADDTPPLPDYVKYNTSQQKLILHFTDAMMTDVEFDSILFAGYNITGTTVEYGDTSEYGWDGPAWLKLSLTPGDISDIEGAGTVMDLIVITFTAGAFTNADGLSNEEWIDFKDGDVRTSGTGATIDSVKILAGIGRDFWLKSKEAFPTLDRKIPATIRKVGEHCIIYVADDQWVPYTEVDMGGESLYNTNNSKVPITQTEVDITYQHFESVDLAYSIINGIFAVGKENVIPDTVNIFLCDIRDEYSLGRNDTKDTYWVGSFFNPNDQKTEWQAADEFNTNDLDLIYIDSWPQLFFDTDSSWYWYETSSVQEWRLNTTPAQGGTFPVTCKHAIDNAYNKLLCYKVDPWESQWMVEGFASLAEFLVEGQASFYGAGNPTTPTANSLKNFSNGLNSRIDFFNAYLFVLYLYEKFGGWDLIKTLSVQPSIDMSSINITFQKMLDSGTGSSTLIERWTDFTAKDVFSYYAVACLLDTTNMNFADPASPNYDPNLGIQPDDYMFNFENVNVQGVVSSKNTTALKWTSVYPPPYYLSTEGWSFKYYYSTFNPLAGLTNPMIAAPNPSGGVAMADTSVLNILLPFDEMNIFRILLKNEAVVTANNPRINWEYFPYDTVTKRVPILQVSPDANWTFTHQAGIPLVPTGDYSTFVITVVNIASTSGFGKLTMGADTLQQKKLSLAQSPIVSSRFDIYLVTSNLLWGDGSETGDSPQLRYIIDEDTSLILMSPNYLLNAEGGEIELSYYSCMTDFDSHGEYELQAFFSDISGREYLLSQTGLQIDSYSPQNGLTLALGDARFELAPQSYPQPLTMSLTRKDENAPAGEQFEYLYRDVLFDAPPVEQRESIGPCYQIQPGITLDEPAVVELPYGDYIGAQSPSELGIYLYRNGGWVYMGGTPNPANQTITTRVKQLGLMQIQSGGHGEIPPDLFIPDRYILSQNYPNPFNPATRIDYQLAYAGKTTLKIFNVMGQEIATLVNDYQNTGFYSVRWDGVSGDGKPVSSGVYFYQLKSGGFTASYKMILMK